MAVTTSANIHFGEGDAWHRWNPGNDEYDAYGALKFGESATVFFDRVARVDEVIAELVALRAEMAPPDDEAWRLTAKGEAALSVTSGPPHHVTGRVAEGTCGAEEDGYICNSQARHDGPEHVAYGSSSAVCHRWPAAGPGGVLFPAADADEGGPMDDDAELHRADAIRDEAAAVTA